MYNFKEAVQCKKCGKIYQDSMPEICRKCGTRIGEKLPTIPFPASYLGLKMNELAEEYLILTDDCRKIVARRKFFKWEIIESE